MESILIIYFNEIFIHSHSSYILVYHFLLLLLHSSHYSTYSIISSRRQDSIIISCQTISSEIFSVYPLFLPTYSHPISFWYHFIFLQVRAEQTYSQPASHQQTNQPVTHSTTNMYIFSVPYYAINFYHLTHARTPFAFIALSAIWLHENGKWNTYFPDTLNEMCGNSSEFSWEGLLSAFQGIAGWRREKGALNSCGETISKGTFLNFSPCKQQIFFFQRRFLADPYHITTVLLFKRRFYQSLICRPHPVVVAIPFPIPFVVVTISVEYNFYYVQLPLILCAQPDISFSLRWPGVVGYPGHPYISKQTRGHKCRPNQTPSYIFKVENWWIYYYYLSLRGVGIFSINLPRKTACQHYFVST